MRYPVRTPEQMALVLQGIRKDLGLTQREAASQVGMLQKTVSMLETKPEAVTVGSLFKLLSALNLELVVQTKDESPAAQADGDVW